MLMNEYKADFLDLVINKNYITLFVCMCCILFYFTDTQTVKQTREIGNTKKQIDYFQNHQLHQLLLVLKPTIVTCISIFVI